MTAECRCAGARSLRARLRAGLIAGLLLAGSTAALPADSPADPQASPQPGPPAAVASSLRLVQALAEGTDLTTYVTVRDEAGDPVPGSAIGPLQATLGAHPAEVVSVTPFADTGEGVLYVFLVDISASLDAAQFGRIRDALRDWVAALGEHDQAAILTFGTDVRTVVAPTAERARLTAALDALRASDPRTAFHGALAQGLALGQQRGERLPTRRALVILSDGLDDAPGGMTIEEVEARLADSPVPIYAVGFSRVRDTAQRERGLATLGRFTRRSGGMFVDASSGDPGSAYAAMREAIRAVERVQLRCPTCVADGNRYRLQIALTVEGLTLTDGTDIRLYPTTPSAPETTAETPTGPSSVTPAVGVDAAAETPPSDAPSTPPASPEDAGPFQALRSRVPGWSWWLGALAVGLALILAGLIRRRARRARPSDDNTVPDAPPFDASEPIPIMPDLDLDLDPRPESVGPQPTAEKAMREAPRPTRAEGPTLSLTFMGGRRRGETVGLVLAPAALIGRSGACALALGDDDEVSAQHARLVVQERLVILADLGSTNGTLLNGVPLSAPSPVRDGDVVRLGQTELRINGVGRW
jgi:Mg-chelatase subunit ChlD